MRPEERLNRIRDLTQEQAVRLYIEMPFLEDEATAPRLTHDEWNALGYLGQKLLKPSLSPSELIHVRIWSGEAVSGAEADKEHKTPGWAIFLFIVFALALLGQIDMGGGGGASHGVARKPTKYEVLSTLQRRYGMNAQLGLVIYWKYSDLVALVGEPDRVATSSTDTYFYYDCVDGTVEIEVNTGVLLQGGDVMVGELRHY
jgi:hypothetical protein